MGRVEKVYLAQCISLMERVSERVVLFMLHGCNG